MIEVLINPKEIIIERTRKATAAERKKNKKLKDVTEYVTILFSNKRPIIEINRNFNEGI